MKNRRLALVAFLLCACMIVGVGYAAVITSLDIDGKVSYTPTDAETNADKIHFTGNTTGADGSKVIASVQSGQQTATLSVNFNSDTLGTANGEGNYQVEVTFEVEAVNSSATEKMVVTFGDLPQVSGNVGTGDVPTNALFNVNATLNGHTDTDGVYTVTVGAGESAKLYLSVVVEVLGDTVTDANTDGKVREAAFEVILPVTSIEYTTAG